MNADPGCMGQECAGSESASELGTLAERLGGLDATFAGCGGLVVVVAQAPALDAIERRYGEEIYRRALQKSAAALQSVCVETLGEEQPIGLGELGRSEIVLLIRRETSDLAFFRHQLPRLVDRIRQRLDRQRARIAYPYVRQLPPFQVGYALALRNPLRSATSQLREAVLAARDDAELAWRIARRDRHWRFVDVVLSGGVHSVYEPIVDAKTLTVFGYEALVRGNVDTEFLGAMQLFEAAEDQGLLFELDCLCRHKAIEGAVDFPVGAKLFVNIRPTSIHDPSFQPDTIKRTLEQCGLAPSDVVFEISEQESIDNYEIFREARDEYGKLGFEFAIDDTGAGYASLEAVMELAPEFIKVDRVFNRGIDEDPARQNMVSAFQDLAHRLNARIIGEGLDTLEELKMLGDLGIHFGQGWLFGKPTPLRA